MALTRTSAIPAAPDTGPSAPSDEALAGRARDGCAASYDELMRRYQVRVLHFLQRRASAADSEDLLQETFLRAYRQLDKYNPRWRFAAWLFTIARRVAINHGQGFRVPVTGAALENLVSPVGTPAEIVALSEGAERLWDVAARVLPEERVTALWLYYVEDLSIQEVAIALARSATAVKVMIWRARRQLVPWLRELDPNGPSRTT